MKTLSTLVLAVLALAFLGGCQQQPDASTPTDPKTSTGSGAGDSGVKTPESK